MRQTSKIRNGKGKKFDTLKVILIASMVYLTALATAHDSTLDQQPKELQLVPENLDKLKQQFN